MQKINALDCKRDILYPACILFFILVFIFFAIAAAADINVFESETVRTQVYDDSTGNNNLVSDSKEPEALPVQTLLGLFLFALSVMILTLIFKLQMNRVYLNLLHFLGTVVAFFVFVLTMTGNLSENGIPQSMVLCLAVSIIYFAVRGVILIIKKLVRPHKNSPIRAKYSKFIGMSFAIFTLLVFIMSLTALITQLDVIVTVKEDKTFIQDDVIQNIFVTVPTPLAPTVQNYLRYLASAVVFTLSYFVLFTKLNKVLKVVLNFVILTAGYLGIWIIGFDYFRLVSQNALPAIVIYLAVYLVVFASVCIYLHIKTKNSELTEDYQRQFK